MTKAKPYIRKTNWLDSTYREERDRKQKISSRKCYLKKAYRITPQIFDDMLNNQNEGCAICGIKAQAHKRLNVDHCHYTGEVRGLLCTQCNVSLGGFKDSTMLLERAIAYLKSY